MIVVLPTVVVAAAVTAATLLLLLLLCLLCHFYISCRCFCLLSLLLLLLLFLFVVLQLFSFLFFLVLFLLFIDAVVVPFTKILCSTGEFKFMDSPSTGRSRGYRAMPPSNGNISYSKQLCSVTSHMKKTIK